MNRDEIAWAQRVFQQEFAIASQRAEELVSRFESAVDRLVAAMPQPAETEDPEVCPAVEVERPHDWGYADEERDSRQCYACGREEICDEGVWGPA